MRYALDFQKANLTEILKYINEISNKFINEIEKVSYVSGDEEIQQLLSENSLNQFLAITYSLNIPINEAKINNSDFEELGQLFGFDDTLENKARLMQMWISLGSALESLLQIFLGVYLRDYENSGWGKWDNFKLDETKEDLLKTLNELKEKEIITQKQKDTFKRDIKEYLKSKQETKHLTDLTLGNLINFYHSNNLWSEKDASEIRDKMDFIRESRNCVHSFKERYVGTWEELLDSLRFFAQVMLELLGRLPDVDDMLQYEMELKAEIEREYYSNYDYY
ncbi:hypothetical protein I5677_09325 [Mobilitalea sibirica]|uniref:Uncharacterized protein n=1 Tax=Mobilitalea sibirica TaxID=1462919 RepID=A0A8J7H9G8_9FIRM|nr:hypothetical protein [Mobilitalea sibirica]MBH1941090.1 hypothetical protein [Mobilitalea sibirica]